MSADLSIWQSAGISDICFVGARLIGLGWGMVAVLAMTTRESRHVAIEIQWLPELRDMSTFVLVACSCRWAAASSIRSLPDIS